MLHSRNPQSLCNVRQTCSALRETSQGQQQGPATRAGRAGGAGGVGRGSGAAGSSTVSKAVVNATLPHSRLQDQQPDAVRLPVSPAAAHRRQHRLPRLPRLEQLLHNRVQRRVGCVRRRQRHPPPRAVLLIQLRAPRSLGLGGEPRQEHSVVLFVPGQQRRRVWVWVGVGWVGGVCMCGVGWGGGGWGWGGGGGGGGGGWGRTRGYSTRSVCGPPHGNGATQAGGTRAAALRASKPGGGQPPGWLLHCAFTSTLGGWVPTSCRAWSAPTPQPRRAAPRGPVPRSPRAPRWPALQQGGGGGGWGRAAPPLKPDHEPESAVVSTSGSQAQQWPGALLTRLRNVQAGIGGGGRRLAPGRRLLPARPLQGRCCRLASPRCRGCAGCCAAAAAPRCRSCMVHAGGQGFREGTAQPQGAPGGLGRPVRSRPGHCALYDLVLQLPE